MIAGVLAAVFLVLPAIALAGKIHEAVEAGDVVAVKQLLAASPELANETTPGGSTPLHMAVGTKDIAMVRVLIEAGASLNAVTPEGYTPLHWAAYMNAGDVAALLIEKGANVNALTKAGLSAFQIAVKENSSDVARLLAEKTGAPYQEAFLDDSFVQGEQALRSGDLARAYSMFNELLKKDPANEKVNFALGLTCKSLRDFSRAQLAFERVLQINPDNDRARFELGRIYLDRKQFAAARSEFQRVLAHEPPAGVKDEIGKLLAQADAGTRKWSVLGRVDVGGLVDDNVNVGPNSETISITPIVFGAQTIDTLTVDSDSLPTRAEGLFASGLLSATYDMGGAGGWAMSTMGAYYQNWLDGARSHESAYFRAGIGPGHVAPKSMFEVPVTASYIENGHEPLVLIYGLAPAFRCVTGAKADWQWTTAGSAEYRDYDTLNDRDGTYLMFGQAAKRYVGAKRHSLSIGIAVLQDYPDQAVYENTAVEWNVAGEMKLPWKSALYGRVRYIRSRYAERETLALEDRSDTQQQFAVGVNKMINRRWGLDVNFQATDSNSTFGLYQYDREVVTVSTFCVF